MRHRAGSTPRQGFTMVELLVVITIIVILIALTLAGIGYARNSARQTQTVNDIRGLDEAVTAFKGKFGVVPPSHIREQATDGNFYIRRFVVPTRIDMPEYRTLRRMYDRWNPETQGGLMADNVTITAAFQPARAGETLDNNQVLVYFLGGPTNQGWSNAGPVAPSLTGNTKIPPFFEFPNGEQLVAVGTAAPRFHDPYGVPYAYFSGNTDNDRYDERAQFTSPWTSAGTRTFVWGTAEVAPATYDPATDTTTTKTAHPMMSPGGKWQAAGRWQIISAGRDKQFGFGSPRLTATPLVIEAYAPGSGNYQLKAPGDDDLSNFSGSMLGVGQ